MSVVLIGFKGCGKSTIGPLLARELGFAFEDIDALVEQRHFEQTGERLGFRDIFKKRGALSFREMESDLLRERLGGAGRVFALGGGTPMAPGVGPLLAPHCVVYLRVEEDVAVERVRAEGWPAYLEGEADPERALRLLFKKRVPRYEELANLIVDNAAPPQEVAGTAASGVRAALGARKN